VLPQDQFGLPSQEGKSKNLNNHNVTSRSSKRGWNTFCPLRAVKGFLCCSSLDSCICKTKLLCNSKRLQIMALARLRHSIMSLKRTGRVNIRSLFRDWIIRRMGL
ncbi:unnamed protein product, partial [Owenia fusiformis]